MLSFTLEIKYIMPQIFLGHNINNTPEKCKTERQSAILLTGLDFHVLLLTYFTNTIY